MTGALHENNTRKLCISNIFVVKKCFIRRKARTIRLITNYDIVQACYGVRKNRTCNENYKISQALSVSFEHSFVLAEFIH